MKRDTHLLEPDDASRKKRKKKDEKASAKHEKRERKREKKREKKCVKEPIDARSVDSQRVHAMCVYAQGAGMCMQRCLGGCTCGFCCARYAPTPDSVKEVTATSCDMH